MRRLRIFTWNIHGSYLFYLAQGNYDIYIPYNQQRSERYVGRGETFPYGENVMEIPAEQVQQLEFDLLLMQCDENYLVDQYELLSADQRSVPKIYIEHDPPWGHPTDTVHPVHDQSITLVHVTHFNNLMWRTELPDVRVIPHGVTTGDSKYKGTLDKGIVVINNLPQRGAMLGFDIFEKVSRHIPLDLVGMGAQDYGIGEVLHPQLPEFMSRYRFFFNPIRYTSLGLSVCEAMMIGMPVVGLATTELPSVISNGINGYIHTNVDYLVEKMMLLLQEPPIAHNLGSAAAERAAFLFDIDRFTTDWEHLFIEKVKSKKIA